MIVFFIDWVGIGFSNNGEPTNADLCVLWSDWKGEIKFEVIFRLESLILLTDHGTYPQLPTQPKKNCSGSN